MSTECKRNDPVLFPSCFVHDHFMPQSCSVHVPFMFPSSPAVLHSCSLYVPFTSLQIPLLLPSCSPPCPSMFHHVPDLSLPYPRHVPPCPRHVPQRIWRHRDRISTKNDEFSNRLQTARCHMIYIEHAGSHGDIRCPCVKILQHCIN